ncbi:DUF294 nucleotidyltransferase-like domain-containing protein [Paenibacillus sp. 1001270B_150601_E10]|uniref:DUF294 nucleotidyltransferase-like domain-containing protein n=1 Tax=Paenibacillus sp. 1001270B_150601_E10 TaxID=2787079 RepID=UPI00189EBFC2|nr:DUF294 nucleotidyltransferase-like domain-containing protein [Paenibacillus sp. 1001270B_150601_E10]
MSKTQSLALQLAQPWMERLSCLDQLPMQERIMYCNQVRMEWMNTYFSATNEGISNIRLGHRLPSSHNQNHISIPLTADQKHELITAVYDHLFQQASGWVEEILEQEGMGKAPVPYACVLFGSGGRMEMTPWSDQDHGLVWDDSISLEAGSMEAYFAAWGEAFTRLLIQLGFPPCSGKVLASNRQWRGSLKEWIARTKRWAVERGWENTRYLTMAMDMRAIYGATELEKQWRGSLNMVSPLLRLEVQRALIANLLHRKPAHNSFGKLIRERYGEDAGRFDVKYRSYVPIVQLARNTAWMEGQYAEALSTKERLLRLSYSLERDSSLDAAVRETGVAWEMVLESRLEALGCLVHGQWQSSGMVDPGRLTTVMKQGLKSSSHAINKWLRCLERRYLHD